MATPLRLMCVAAHPDDEDGATLAYYNRGFGVQTSIMLANWGEGGQNEIGPELYEELGVIRSHETLEAAQLVGTGNVYCLNQKDFGFSKTIEETWKFWDRSQALERAVRILRTERPHVVITNHRVGEGHGNHQAMAELIVEAVIAAGSEEEFVEQIEVEGLQPWKDIRLFQRRRHHEGGPFEEFDVAVPVGQLEPIRDFTYQEIASEALNRHRSQGIKGVWGYVNLLRRESPKTFFALTSGPRPSGAIDDLFTGFESAWWTHEDAKPFSNGVTEVGHDPELAGALSRVMELAAVDPSGASEPISYALHALSELNTRIDSDPRWSREEPAAIISGNVGWTSEELAAYQVEVVDRLGAIGELQKQLESVLARTWGVDLIAKVDGDSPVPGGTFFVEAEIRNRGTDAVAVSDLNVRVPAGWTATIKDASPGAVLPLETKEVKCEVTVAANAQPTLPYTDELYRHPTPWMSNIQIHALLMNGELTGSASSRLRVEVAPEWQVEVEPSHRIFNLAQPATSEFVVEVHANGARAGNGTLAVKFPDGKLVQREVAIPKGGTVSEKVAWIPPASMSEGRQDVAAILNSEGKVYEGRTAIGLARVTVPETLEVGVVQSYDRTLPDALAALDIRHSLLTEDDLSTSDLGRYGTVLIDIRGYLEREDLRMHNARLLEYVKQGGRMVVFYHKSFDWNDADPPYAPYPLQLSRDRVTEEDAPVEVLSATHPLLLYPNTIGPEDWIGWVHERGLYFPGPYDSAYQEVVTMADSGSEPLRSGILLAAYGTGTYVYTPLSWYRQLQAGIPGAYRLFVNLISPETASRQ